MPPGMWYDLLVPVVFSWASEIKYIKDNSVTHQTIKPKESAGQDKKIYPEF